MQIKKIFENNHLVLQEADFTCGPVALLNILALKGDSSHGEEKNDADVWFWRWDGLQLL